MNSKPFLPHFIFDFVKLPGMQLRRLAYLWVAVDIMKALLESIAKCIPMGGGLPPTISNYFEHTVIFMTEVNLKSSRFLKFSQFALVYLF